MLRDYQQRAIHNVYEQWQSGHRETLLVAATGAGKTQMYLSIGMEALDIDPDARALVIAHRRELIEQPIERIKLMKARGQWKDGRLPTGLPKTKAE